MNPRFEVIQELHSHSRARLLRVRDLEAEGAEVTIRRYMGTPEEIESLQSLLIGVAELDHPNIERFIELGDDEEGLFAVVEAPWGESLAEVLANGPLTAVEFDQVTRQLLEALSTLHSGGYPHLALRPEVVRMLKDETGAWQIRLTGFGEGFSKPQDAEQADIAAYRCCAPEHWRGEPVGRRTDVYALGCILYEALAGRQAFPGNNAQTLRQSHLEHDVTPLDKEAPQVARWVAAWVMKLMEPDVGYRLKNMEQARGLYDMGEQSLPATLSALAPPPPPVQNFGRPAEAPVWAVPVAEAETPAPTPIQHYPVSPATAMVPVPIQPGSYTTQMVPVGGGRPVTPGHGTAPRPVAAVPGRGSRPVALHPASRSTSAVRAAGGTGKPARSGEEKRVLFSIIGGAVCLVAIVLFFVLGRSGSETVVKGPSTLTVTNGILIHLDSTAAGTLSLDPSTGRIRRWENVKGGPLLAVQMDGNAQPARSTKGPGGKLVVDFGGPGSGRWMQFGNSGGGLLRQDKIRTVFWVGRGVGFLLGDNSTYSFHRGYPEWSSGGGAIWSDKHIANEVKNGVTRLNGQTVDGNKAKFGGDEMTVISLVTTGNVAASYLCRDRDIAVRTGGQTIGEVILYNRALSDSEVQQVEGYLMSKWQTK